MIMFNVVKISDERINSILPQNIKDSEVLNQTEKKVLGAILHYFLVLDKAKENKYVILPNEDLRKTVGCRKTDVLSSVQNLIEYKLIKRECGKPRQRGEKAEASKYFVIWDNLTKPIKKPKFEDYFSMFISPKNNAGTVDADTDVDTDIDTDIDTDEDIDKDTDIQDIVPGTCSNGENEKNTQDNVTEPMQLEPSCVGCGLNEFVVNEVGEQVEHTENTRENEKDLQTSLATAFENILTPPPILPPHAENNDTKSNDMEQAEQQRSIDSLKDTMFKTKVYEKFKPLHNDFVDKMKTYKATYGKDTFVERVTKWYRNSKQYFAKNDKLPQNELDILQYHQESLRLAKNEEEKEMALQKIENWKARLEKEDYIVDKYLQTEKPKPKQTNPKQKSIEKTDQLVFDYWLNALANGNTDDIDPKLALDNLLERWQNKYDPSVIEEYRAKTENNAPCATVTDKVDNHTTQPITTQPDARERQKIKYIELEEERGEDNVCDSAQIISLNKKYHYERNVL